MQKLIQAYQKSLLIQKLQGFLDEGKKEISIAGLSGSQEVLVCGAVSHQAGVLQMLVLEDREAAGYFYHDLCQICKPEQVLFFPSSYKRNVIDGREEPGDIILRTEVLNRLNSSHPPVFLVSYLEAIAERVVSEDTIRQASISLKAKEQRSITELERWFQEHGFEQVDFVFEPGQYAIRGGIVDVFSYAYEHPFRLDFWGNNLDDIRSFDEETQLSILQHTEVTLSSKIYVKAVADSCAFFDLLPSHTIAWLKDPRWLKEKIKQLYARGREKEEDSAWLAQWVEQELLLDKLEAMPQVQFVNSAQKANIKVSTEPQPAFHKKFDLVQSTLHELQEANYRICIASDNPKQLERLKSIFAELDKNIHFEGLDKTLHEGFIDHQEKICCFTDHQLFGRFHKYQLKTDGNKRSKALSSLKELSQLQPGDYIVHADHGIGKFMGLVKMPTNGKVQEVIKLSYKNNDQLFVSIHALHRISKYKSKDGAMPKMNKLGTGAWQKLKDRTKKKVKDIAEDLIKLYAERLQRKGFAFSPDTFLQQELEASFLYEDTPDQLSTTQAVKKDMERPVPMDRLVCGDVGFGKTEIAIRAAFKAVTDNKQVAILVPTTILAFQHFRTFQKRLKDFPCRIDYLSRLRSPKAIKQSLKDLEAGKIDIVIGTHRLIGKDVKFKDLGLLVIDEEQKFGVSVKEKLKQLKVDVDTLTLTATPIPRTLQFSLMGARDLSVMNTPPPNRHPIHTELCPFNEELVAEFINYELARNGQTFIIHNRIQSIFEIEALVKKVVPEASVVVGHGQMEGAELEKVMLDFVNGDYDVLIATTIIESGLDIPNANTIIINQAQNFGLSDLHQLRGRVGRSNKKAFCYLFAPPLSSLSDEARKRLNAIENFAELGSGFNIALQDLDIRGAGNMLGGEQSGFIADIGMDTYHKILNEAIEELKEDEFAEIFSSEEKEAGSFVRDCIIESDLELAFPDNYVSHIAERVELYRQLDNISSPEALDLFKGNLEDRFGKIPAQAMDLLEVIPLRQLAMSLGIEKLTLKQGRMIVYFVSNKLSKFYESSCFLRMMAYLNDHPRFGVIKQDQNKLWLIVPQVSKLQVAIQRLGELAGHEKGEGEKSIG